MRRASDLRIPPLHRVSLDFGRRLAAAAAAAPRRPERASPLDSMFGAGIARESTAAAPPAAAAIPTAEPAQR